MWRLVATFCGYLSTACFSFLLAPQIILNWKRQSTEGLSLVMIMLWHFADIAWGAYFLYTHQPLALLLQMLFFQLAAIITEAQYVLYSPALTKYFTPQKTECEPLLGSPESDRLRHTLRHLALVVGVGALFTFISVAGTLLLYQWFAIPATPEWVRAGMGSVFPSVSYVLSFIPQLRLAHSLKSMAGVSLGMVLMDLAGCLLSIFAMSLTHWDTYASVPYFTIIVFQLILFCLSVFVYKETTP
eukprot:NODE_4408_length_793_cov_30.969970_g4249_i0.p1 GENE.NODE_4408_length_793_cov_30.969970_g4249_i0~~NODE_4408_length_793_cov_30.969970_g4249_i0.p1  ORF type:complete len:255 (-),score=69.82 NODE_4408_length_793_cov_30.969970_g4249_i0:28-756(-)